MVCRLNGLNLMGTCSTKPEFSWPTYTMAIIWKVGANRRSELSINTTRHGCGFSTREHGCSTKYPLAWSERCLYTLSDTTGVACLGSGRSPGWKPEPPWKAQQQGSSFLQGPKQKLTKANGWNLKMRVFEKASPFPGVHFLRLELVVFRGCVISSCQDKLNTLRGAHTDQMW